MSELREKNREDIGVAMLMAGRVTSKEIKKQKKMHDALVEIANIATDSLTKWVDQVVEIQKILIDTGYIDEPDPNKYKEK